jgi:hypothetical protein
MADRKLQVTFSDGSKWEVPARVIAENRADYYATEVDGQPKGSKEWLEEVRTTLSDDYDIRDWALNNMNWSDLAPHARRVAPPPQQNYEEQWGSAELEVVS